MAYEQKPGDGSLFPNSYKEQGDKKPDFKGSVMTPDGKKLEIAGWWRQGKDGKADWLSVKVSEPRERNPYAGATANEAMATTQKSLNPPPLSAAKEEFTDNLPF